MGSDDLFHKRKAKTAKDLQRRRSRREEYAKILIVCEGEKTEPLYFHGIRDHYGLNTANIEISGDCGSDPRSIVEYAKQRFREEKDSGDAFDKVFCVFDKDSHTEYDQALSELKNARPQGTYVAITSVPCFEYWLLLHFQYSTRAYSPLPGKSTGDQVLADLRNYMPDYQKGVRDVFSELLDQLEFAKNNASRALAESDRNATDNPSTHVHVLVEFMQNIKDI